MKLSTMSRDGLRFMLAPARNYGKGNTLLKDIAREEAISEKYLRLIIIPLKTAGPVNSAGGRPAATRWPRTLTLSSITLDQLVKMNQDKEKHAAIQNI